MTAEPPVPVTIRQLQRAAYPGYALLASIQLDLFSALATGPKSVSELADQLSLDEQKLQILMYVLASTGLLSVNDGCFSNSTEAEALGKGWG